ncbi:transcriptional regulator [Sporosarcina sp. P18a]|uniref:transcriptional regulator n=1 Tax=Sporosarcina sp. P18a TaxID=2048259 RepID=UPI001E581B9D|nr:transcriptional regulator [Sporosarcina sp. P18a]
MRKTLEKSVRYGEMLEVMYMSKDGQISKRRVKVLQVGESSFRAYCYLRKSKRTFLIGNVLAAVPVIVKESVVI